MHFNNSNYYYMDMYYDTSNVSAIYRITIIILVHILSGHFLATLSATFQ